MNSERISVDQAIERLSRQTRCLGTENIELDRAAGRILRQPVLSDRDLPPFDRVMMDGIAIKYRTTDRAWRIVDIQYAGEAARTLPDEGKAIEIMTGAVLPSGADTVIPVEDLNVSGETVSLREGVRVDKGQFLHRRGQDCPQGEPLLDPLVCLDGPALALCGSVGASVLKVARRPGITFLSTGDELVPVHESPEPFQIRRTNHYLVEAELRKAGLRLQENRHLIDDREAILGELNRWKAYQDIILLSGGVSKGKADYIPTCAWEAGFEVIFHGVAQKPGGPLLAAVHPNGCLLLGLPGNPISTLVCARIYLRKILALSYGFPFNEGRAVIRHAIRKKPGVARFVPVEWSGLENGKAVVEPVAINNSGDMVGLQASSGLVFLEGDQQTEVEAGTVCKYYDWNL